VSFVIANRQVVAGPVFGAMVKELSPMPELIRKFEDSERG
jgi:hypothetical protein